MRLYDYSPSANGYKVRLLLRQLGLEPEVVEVDIFERGEVLAHLLPRNAAGQVPVLDDVEGGPIAESNAILFYLAQGTPFLPEERALQAKVLQWMFFEQNAIEPNLGTGRFWKLTGRHESRRAEWENRLAKGEAALRTMERHLEGRTFFVAERYTIADIALYAFVHCAPDAGVSLEALPLVRRWIAAVEAQPGHFSWRTPYTPSAFVNVRGG